MSGNFAGGGGYGGYLWYETDTSKFIAGFTTSPPPGQSALYSYFQTPNSSVTCQEECGTGGTKFAIILNDGSPSVQTGFFGIDGIFSADTGIIVSQVFEIQIDNDFGAGFSPTMATPLPSTWGMMILGLGLGLLGFMGSRRKRSLASV